MLYNYKGDGRSWCKCECECGNICIKDTYSIRHLSYPAHCGCKTEYYKQKQAECCRKDVTGKRFGNLVVQKMIYEYKTHTLVECLCDCGNTVIKPLTYLTSGNTTSCGCVRSKATSLSNTKDFSGIKSKYGIIFINQDHKNKYGQWIWKCRCGVCGKEFLALPAKVLNGHTTSCGCATRSSKERFIENLLKELDINYITEYLIKPDDNTPSLRIDFFLPDIITAIEYNGIQHYKAVDLFGGENQFQRQIINDKRKQQYCIDHGIKLIIIPYTYTDEEIKTLITNIIYPERLSCVM